MAYILLESNEKIENLEMDALYSFLSTKPIEFEKILLNSENLSIYDDNDMLFAEMIYAIIDQYEEINPGLWRLTIHDKKRNETLQDMFNSKLDYIALSIGLDLDGNDQMPLSESGSTWGDPHSRKYNTLLRYFKTGLWNEPKMRLAVDKGWITMLEFEQITGLKY